MVVVRLDETVGVVIRAHVYRRRRTRTPSSRNTPQSHPTHSVRTLRHTHVPLHRAQTVEGIVGGVYDRVRRTSIEATGIEERGEDAVQLGGGRKGRKKADG